MVTCGTAKESRLTELEGRGLWEKYRFLTCRQGNWSIVSELRYTFERSQSRWRGVWRSTIPSRVWPEFWEPLKSYQTLYSVQRRDNHSTGSCDYDIITKLAWAEYIHMSLFNWTPTSVLYNPLMCQCFLCSSCWSCCVTNRRGRQESLATYSSMPIVFYTR